MMRKVSALLLIILMTQSNYAAKVSRFLPSEPKTTDSALRIATIDFLLPGYGTYVQNQNGFAAIYFGANIASLASIYVAWRNWRFYESAYVAAGIRQASEPDRLLFQDPTGGSDYLSLQDIKNRAERGQLFFAIAITANIALRFFSAYHSWSLADETATQTGPRYEFYPDERGGLRSETSYFMRF